MTLADLNQELYLVITNEVDKKSASRLADLLLREKLIPCVTLKTSNHIFGGKEI